MCAGWVWIITEGRQPEQQRGHPPVNVQVGDSYRRKSEAAGVTASPPHTRSCRFPCCCSCCIVVNGPIPRAH